MALVVKLDVNGSSQALGFTSSSFDRATRRALVTGLADPSNTGGQDKIGAAIRAVISALETENMGGGSSFHPDHPPAGSWNGPLVDSLPDPVGVDNFLPTARIRAQRLGPDRAWVFVDYAVPPQTGGGGGGPSGFTIASFRGTFEDDLVYRSNENAGGSFIGPVNGLPSGKILIPDERLSDDSYKPEGRIQRTPVFKIYVPTVLSFNPIGGPIVGAIGAVNNGPVTFGGYAFLAETIRFDGIEVDWIGSSIEPESYEVNYVFTARSGGFYYQEVYFDDDAMTWVVENVRAYQAVSFETVFPV